MTDSALSPTRAEPTPNRRQTGKRERTKAKNREEILEAARIVFAELGYGETTVRDIIRRTGLASGTFYNYFRSKEEVFQALMDQSALRIRPRLRAERIRARSFEEFVEATFRAYFEYLAQDRATYAVMRRNSGALRVRMDTQEIVAGFEELRDDIEKAIKDGILPAVDADYLTAAAVGVAFEIGDRMISRDTIDFEGAAEFATALFLGGVKALPVAKTKKT